MELLSWKESLEMGISEIDDQHRYLVELANRVIEAVHRQQGAAVIGDVVKQLRNYTVEHFRAEERYMETLDYAKLPAHHLEHERLKSQVRQWQRDLYTNRNVSAGEVLVFLRGWLLEHILKTDMAFKAWLTERSGSASKQAKNGPPGGA